VTNEDCQYYIDYDDLNITYKNELSTYGFIIPTNFVYANNVTHEEPKELLPVEIRGKRYVF
jgi:hypothetical protein